MPLSRYRPAKVHEELGPAFFDVVEPASFPQTRLRYRNQRAAAQMGLDHLTDARWVDHFGRFAPLPDNVDHPLALRYHGHQFQTYNADLGDGRGFLFAQAYDDQGRLLDFGTKGSGTTPWSRGGDGRLTLKGGVREVLATEMLEALGVNTSKSFSLVETGEALHRGDEPSPTRSSVLVRLSHSHIRIGTFQRLAFHHDDENLARLVDHVVDHYLPQAKRGTAAQSTAAMLEATVEQVARTGAQWVAAGFVHGVLNTDNINITGESFDYGPWRFLPHYDPGFTAAYFDQTGLYAFGRQLDALAWNLTRLAECLLPLADNGVLEPALNSFWPAIRTELPRAFLRRLGLKSRGLEADVAFLRSLLEYLQTTKAGYAQFFFDWFGGAASAKRAAQSPQATLYNAAAFSRLGDLLSAHEPVAPELLQSAYFSRSRPATLLIEDVETLWAPIAEADDWSLFSRKLEEIEQMRVADTSDRAE